MPRTVSLDVAELLLAADLYGNPVRVERIRRTHRSGAGRQADRAGCSFRPSRPIDARVAGGCTLSHAVSEQRGVERRDRSVIERLDPRPAAKDVRLLETVLLESRTLREAAAAEGISRQAASQRLATMCRRYPGLAIVWRRRKESGAEASRRSSTPRRK